MKLAYYPGCSLHGTGKEYDISTRGVCRQLGIELQEIEDWNCCGATSAHSLDKNLSYYLPGRNLKIIQQTGLDVVIPCAACFSRTRCCADALANDPQMRQLLEKKLNYKFHNDTQIYHLMELLAQQFGLEQIKSRVTRPLNGLKVVCYYGCLLVRPHQITRLDDKENPQLLDELMRAIGATSIDWPFKTECCGASLSLTRPTVVMDLIKRMTDWMQEADIDAIVTACPLCQSNLEMRQSAERQIPVFYFTELLGLALGSEEAAAVVKKHLVSTDNLVAKLMNNISAAAEVTSAGKNT